MPKMIDLPYGPQAPYVIASDGLIVRFLSRPDPVAEGEVLRRIVDATSRRDSLTGAIATMRALVDLPPESETEKPVKGRDRVFVHGNLGQGKTGTYCQDCIPKDIEARLGDGDVDTWTEGSDGWLTAPVCDVCKTSLRVVVNGKR